MKQSQLSPQLPSVRAPDPLLEQPAKAELGQQVWHDEVSGRRAAPAGGSQCLHPWLSWRRSRPGTRCGAPGTAAAATRRGGTRRAARRSPGRRGPAPGCRYRRGHRGASRSPPSSARAHPRAVRQPPVWPHTALGTGALGRRPQRPLSIARARALAVAATRSSLRASAPAWRSPPPPSFSSISRLSDWALSHASLFSNKCTTLHPHSLP